MLGRDKKGEIGSNDRELLGQVISHKLGFEVVISLLNIYSGELEKNKDFFAKNVGLSFNERMQTTALKLNDYLLKINGATTQASLTASYYLGGLAHVLTELLLTLAPECKKKGLFLTYTLSDLTQVITSYLSSIEAPESFLALQWESLSLEELEETQQKLSIIKQASQQLSEAMIQQIKEKFDFDLQGKSKSYDELPKKTDSEFSKLSLEQQFAHLKELAKYFFKQYTDKFALIHERSKDAYDKVEKKIKASQQQNTASCVETVVLEQDSDLQTEEGNPVKIDPLQTSSSSSEVSVGHTSSGMHFQSTQAIQTVQAIFNSRKSGSRCPQSTLLLKPGKKRLLVAFLQINWILSISKTS